MKIIDERASRMVLMRDIPVGETFVYCGRYYIKIEDNEMDICQACSLSNGCVITMSVGSWGVIPIKAELRIIG